MSEDLYRSYNSYLRDLFGCRVQKISLDAGLSCPNRDGTLGSSGCIYCNERGSGTGAAEESSIGAQIREAKAILRRRYNAKRFIAYFQSFSNTYAPLPRLRELYAEALEDPEVVGLSIGTRPDCVPDEVLDHLRALSAKHLIWLEYGLQSAKDSTLERINRRHSVETFSDAVRRTRTRGLSVCAHVILGLPGETSEDMLNTARFIAGRDIQAVKIHSLYVIRGTVLHGWHRAGKYVCPSREEYAATAGDFLSLLPPGMIVQRLTGDPHPSELVAPSWALEKRKNIEAVHDHMRRHRLRQGSAFQG